MKRVAYGLGYTTFAFRHLAVRRPFPYWDHGWVVAPGAYGIAVGWSSRDLPPRARLALR